MHVTSLFRFIFIGLNAFAFAFCPGSFRVSAGEFEMLGIPVKTTRIQGVAIGKDAKNNDLIYFNCAQPGNTLFLLQVNPNSGETRQFDAPIGEGAWAMTVASDKCVYLGTWESGYLLKFDPRNPDAGLVSLGKPSTTETYIWQLAVGSDGNLYGCTYPQAKLVRYDPKTNQSEDLGRLDPKEMYARHIAASTNGFIYVGIGTVRAQVVRFDPATGTRKSLFLEDQRPPGTARVFQAKDGNVYATVGGKKYRCEGDTLVSVQETSGSPNPTLSDGRIVGEEHVEGEKLSYELRTTKGQKETRSVSFQGAGLQIFAVGNGPNGCVYGSTFLPLEMFDFNPATKQSKHLGNPTDVDGEIYSFTTDGKLLYLCAYPGSFLSIYDPKRDWNYGRAKTNNPRGIGPMGDGHLRPCAMLMGTDGRIYVGSLPPYGQVGGSLGIYDPMKDAVVENYRNIITNQGIASLCEDTATGRIFAGSSIEGGGGAKPVAKEGFVFVWNPNKKMKVWEQTIVPGDTRVIALTAAKAKIFGLSRPSNTLFVIDARSFAILHKAVVPFGPVRETCLGYLASHDRIYGIAGNNIFAIDPETFALTKLAESKEKISCGFALNETGLYFGSKARLVRWRW